MKPGIVYRMFDTDGTLLYIGHTAAGPSRFDLHASNSAWWSDVARIELTHFSTREEAFNAERDAIFDEQPLWNRQCRDRRHAPRPPQLLTRFNRYALIEMLSTRQMERWALARATNTSVEYLDGILAGAVPRPTLSLVLDLAYALDCNADILQPGITGTAEAKEWEPA